jgi:hypothetical protein
MQKHLVYLINTTNLSRDKAFNIRSYSSLKTPDESAYARVVYLNTIGLLDVVGYLSD